MDALPEQVEYGELKLAEIIGLLAVCQNPTVENKLLTLFYKRTSSKFYDRCSKVVGKLHRGNPELKAITDDVFQDSIILICEKIKTFKTQPSWNDEECEKTLLSWMSHFPNFLLLNSQKVNKKDLKSLEKYLRYQENEDSEGTVGNFKYKRAYDKERFDKVWENLSPMAREIILACVDNHMFEEDGPKHLSSDFRKYLCEKYNVVPDTLRQAKRRALSALESCKIE